MRRCLISIEPKSDFPEQAAPLRHAFGRERVYDLLGKRTEQPGSDGTRPAGKSIRRCALLRAQIAPAGKVELMGDYAAAKSSAQAAIREIEADDQLRRQALISCGRHCWRRVMFLAGQVVDASLN
jgi:hypothetical protein